MSNFLASIFVITSTIIGLGVFVLPYAYIHSGNYFWLWFLFVLVSFLIIHLVYSEIIFTIKEKHNLPGIAGILLGENFKKYIWILDFWGIQLVFWAYLLALPPIINSIITVNPLILKLVISFLVILIIVLEANPFAKLDSLISSLLLLIFIWVILIFLPKIQFSNLTFDFLDPVLAYGILIFSFTGYSSLQIVYDLIGADKRKMLWINVISLLTIAVLYALFTLAIAGTLGQAVSEETISSVAKIINKQTLVLLVALAFLNIFTTFIALAFYLKRGLILDFNLSKLKAWTYTSLPILIFVFLDFPSLAKLVSAIGSLFIGLNLIVILICYLRLKEKRYFHFPNFVVISFIIFYIIGLISNLLYEFF